MSAGVEGSESLDVRPRRMFTESIDADVDSDQERPMSGPSTGSGPADEAPRSSVERGSSGKGPSKAGSSKMHDHPLLIDAHEDRWRWRRRIRENPRKLFFYRICVGFVGLLLICLAALTGPIPGPGGIPLAILGIAVWSSEFEWAQRLMIWFKAQLKRYLALPRSHRVLFWSTLAVCGLTGAYLVLLFFGVPFWVPEFAAQWLRHLPGV